MEEATTTEAERERTRNDPRENRVDTVEELDPHSGVSDDPRVDPTPDRRHTEDA